MPVDSTPSATSTQQTWSKRGPSLVALGAFLWALDGLFRAKLAVTVPPLLLVTISHWLCLPFALVMIWRRRSAWRGFRPRDWLAVSYLAVAGGALAMVLFTYSFQWATNYTVPVLMQKLQPFFAMLFAMLVLGERPQGPFWWYGSAAILGAYMVTFGQGSLAALGAGDAIIKGQFWPAIAALAAAALWAGCTVAGRFLSQTYDFWTVTGLRYGLAMLVLTAASGMGGYFDHLPALSHSDWLLAVGMALGPGLLALLIYYYGLQRTPASIATLAELSFPIGAVVVNWIALDSALDLWQIVGACVLVLAVYRLSLRQTAAVAVGSARLEH